MNYSKAVGLLEAKLHKLNSLLKTNIIGVADNGILTHYNRIDFVQAIYFINIHVET
jgi:hypothetical protein